MEVILREDVATLGHAGEVVKVADGYGRNYLLPRRLAVEATASNKAVIDQMKQSGVRRTAKEKFQAEELVKQLDSVELSFTRKAGKDDTLFGSVTSADIAPALDKKGLTSTAARCRCRWKSRSSSPANSSFRCACIAKSPRTSRCW